MTTVRTVAPNPRIRRKLGRLKTNPSDLLLSRFSTSPAIRIIVKEKVKGIDEETYLARHTAKGDLIIENETQNKNGQEV